MKTERQKLIDIMMQNLDNAINDPYRKMFTLSAIWLNQKLKTATETKLRLTTDDLVLIEDGELKDCTGEPTHKVILLHGTSANTMFTITVQNLITNELSIVKL